MNSKHFGLTYFLGDVIHKKCSYKIYEVDLDQMTNKKIFEKEYYLKSKGNYIRTSLRCLQLIYNYGENRYS